MSKSGKFYTPLFSKLVLNCKAEGFPTPEIRWFKENNLLASSQKNGLSVKYNFFLSNGSLVINNISSNDDGVYYCYASSLSKFPVSSLNYTIKGNILLS